MSLTQSLHRAVQQHPDGTATVYRNRRQSWRTLRDRVAALASSLRALGLEPGERVAILALNSDRYAECILGTWWAGAVVNPVNTRWSLAEMAYSLNDSESAVLVVDDAFAQLAAELRTCCPCIRQVLSIGEESVTSDYEALLAAAAPATDRCSTGNELAVLCYTGGTTGAAKGVMLSHAGMWSSTMSRIAGMSRRPASVAMCLSPLFHVGGLGPFVAQCTVGGTQVFLPSFTAEGVLESVEREGIDTLTLVPTMIQMLLEHPAFDPARLASLKRIVYGASPISEPLLDRALAQLPGVEFYQNYGQTEASPLITVNPPENHSVQGRRGGRLRSAGKAIHCVELRIVDGEDNEVARGTVGEIAMRGPNTMLGYWKKPAETANALRGGWLHTGDGAWMDDEGYIYVVDRLKDMIISGGENVYSSEVENAIARHPAVAQCAVIGVESAQWGESVHAAVVLKPGAALDERELKAHVRTLIAGYKCPKSVQFRTELPLSPAGKVLKTVLREDVRAARTLPCEQLERST